MTDEKFIMFRNRLQKVYRHFTRHAKRLNISCYRVYDHDLPEFPLCIEVYDRLLYVAEYKRRHVLTDEQYEQWLQETTDVLCQVFGISRQNIFFKLRRRKPGRLGQYQREATAGQEAIVDENGLKFIVNLSDYIDTGLFLDHRITRQIVREQAMGKKILNLFCYTGSFSVYAAAGGALEVTSVDLSNTYLNWAKRNMELNGFTDQRKYRFAQADARKYLKNIPSDYFDIVILDPPTFSNSKRMQGFLDIQTDHVALINDCVASLRTSGILYFSTNKSGFKLDAGRITASAIKDITNTTTPFDFEGRIQRSCYVIEK